MSARWFIFNIWKYYRFSIILGTRKENSNVIIFVKCTLFYIYFFYKYIFHYRDPNENKIHKYCPELQWKIVGESCRNERMKGFEIPLTLIYQKKIFLNGFLYDYWWRYFSKITHTVTFYYVKRVNHWCK